MTKELEKEYSKWVVEKGIKLRKWGKLNREQKWFVFVNARAKMTPKVAIKVNNNMLWSSSNPQALKPKEGAIASEIKGY